MAIMQNNSNEQPAMKCKMTVVNLKIMQKTSIHIYYWHLNIYLNQNVGICKYFLNLFSWVFVYVVL